MNTHATQATGGPLICRWARPNGPPVAICRHFARYGPSKARSGGKFGRFRPAMATRERFGGGSLPKCRSGRKPTMVDPKAAGSLSIWDGHRLAPQPNGGMGCGLGREGPDPVLQTFVAPEEFAAPVEAGSPTTPCWHSDDLLRSGQIDFPQTAKWPSRQKSWEF